MYADAVDGLDLESRDEFDSKLAAPPGTEIKAVSESPARQRTQQQALMAAMGKAAGV